MAQNDILAQLEEESEELRVWQKKARRSRPTFSKFLLAIFSALFIGLGAYFMLGGNVLTLTTVAGNLISGQEGAQMSAPQKAASYYITLPAITVNLISNDGRDAYLKISPVLEFNEKDINEIIAERRPRIIDSFTSLMRNLRVVDLKGSAGTQMLREELTKRANIALHPYKINAVRFEEIVIQ